MLRVRFHSAPNSQAVQASSRDMRCKMCVSPEICAGKGAVLTSGQIPDRNFSSRPCMILAIFISSIEVGGPLWIERRATKWFSLTCPEGHHEGEHSNTDGQQDGNSHKFLVRAIRRLWWWPLWTRCAWKGETFVSCVQIFQQIVRLHEVLELLLVLLALNVGVQLPREAHKRQSNLPLSCAGLQSKPSVMLDQARALARSPSRHDNACCRPPRGLCAVPCGSSSCRKSLTDLAPLRATCTLLFQLPTDRPNSQNSAREGAPVPGGSLLLQLFDSHTHTSRHKEAGKRLNTLTCAGTLWMS
mmetsp:Transcript_11517/g.35196  ORF Transcript_11517/g.35196 Transcript_11517/m.35196 type:complete len:300 (-) Transcript_11517:26-925(-)